MRKLKRWMKQNGVSQTDLAKRAKMSKAGLCRILSGSTPDPGGSKLYALERATRGAVKMQDMVRNR